MIVLSDNGGPTAELTSYNKPLRGGKGQLYEGGIRVPFAMQWKGRLPAGTTDHALVISLDIAPTVLAAAGPAAPVPASLDGVNLLDRAHHSRPRALFWRYGRNIAVREGDWKLVRQASTSFELFHLGDDAAEARDQAEAQPAIAARLHARLDEWTAGMKPALW